jgi:hypothetical protein
MARSRCDAANDDPSMLGDVGTLPADSQPPPPLAELDSDSNSNSNSDTFALRVFWRTTNTYGCPVCPNYMHQWRNLNEIKDHVLGMARFEALREDNMNKWSHHRILARNEGWM